MEQTAVQWLYEKILLTPLDIREINKCLEQALEMEKEQIVQAHSNKQKTKSNPDSIVTFGYTYTGEMYYNQKYKGINPII